jgi:hypothetical protein
MVDLNKDTQHITKSKKEEIKYSCYFVIVDKILNGLGLLHTELFKKN